MLVLGAGALFSAPLACSEQEVVAQLRSLSASEDALFLCRDDAGNGHPYTDCPDRDSTDDLDPKKHLSVMALVSQTLTDEVAVVNVTSGNVVDTDPSTPGYGFLRVGGRPVAMAATPGGSATFVATADVGRSGLFALPTKCLGAPAAGEPHRDLTTWPACRLPETPGEIAMVIQPGDCHAANASAAGTGAGGAGAGGAGAGGAAAEAGDAGGAADNAACTADLDHEGGTPGTRKIVVSFPDSGTLRVIDAQKLLNTPPGEFPPCDFDAELPLKVEIPAGVAPILPPDLVTTCAEDPPPGPPKPSAQAPRPAGFAQADGKLYIADRAAPVIHVVDTSDACNLTELPSLLPMSVREPERVVTTRRLAVSPLTPAGQRFVYAIDSEDRPFASVMVFDVSPGSTNPTPIVRPHAPELLGEKPDRLTLDGPARDVTFAYRDIPYVDPETGTAQFGSRCSPTGDANSPGGLARPSVDLTLGARPGLLRGLFGFILQTDGKIAIIDVDDFDADCRRPATGNDAFRGCEADTKGTSFTNVETGAVETDANLHQLVTGENSCRIVEPHRIRSAHPVVSNSSAPSAREPSLRTFPQLTFPATKSDTAVLDRPRILAVPYDEKDDKGRFKPADVLVGATLYSTAEDAAQPLETNPSGTLSEPLQQQNAVILPPLEPRSYASDSKVQVVFEGSYAGDRNAGFWATGEGQLELKDDSLSFCGAGVYDEATMADYGVSELGVPSDAAKAFGVEHADFVQITSDFPAEDDSYWQHVTGEVNTRQKCDDLFFAFNADTLAPARDLKIVSASDKRLVLKPATSGVAADAFRSCFPGAMTYRLRAGNQWVVLHNDAFVHDVVATGTNSACQRSCSPLKKWSKSRVFEISSVADNCLPAKPPGDPLDLRVGCAAPDEVACVYDQGSGSNAHGVGLDDAAARCIFNGLNERFALYRGRAPSPRDATFTWQVTSGFVPLVMSMTSLSSAVSPQSIQYLGQVEQLAIVDGTTLGLTLFSLDTFSVVKPSPFY